MTRTVADLRGQNLACIETQAFSFHGTYDIGGGMSHSY